MSILLTTKLGMISVISDNGNLVPVTLLKVEPNYVSQIKTSETDGYDALQISANVVKKISKPKLGHLKKAKIKHNLKFSRELRLKDRNKDLLSNYNLGSEIDLLSFQPGDTVNATAKSKGKGFAGTIKRHNFSRGSKSHGGKGSVRKPGSIGTIGQGIMKGQKMAGRLGGQKTTTKGLKISLVDDNKRVIGVKGAIPGPKKALVIIRKIA